MTMRIAPALFLALLTLTLLALTLAACGGEEQPGEDGEAAAAHTPPGPGEIPKAMAPTLQPAREITLDDTSLGALLALHEKVVAAGADVSGAMAIGAGSEHDYAWYMQALRTWRALEEATAGSDVARRELERLDERIRELETQVAAAASDEEKAETQRTLDLTRRMRPALAKHVASLEGLDSAGNRTLVEHWKPRFDAVAAKAEK